MFTARWRMVLRQGKKKVTAMADVKDTEVPTGGREEEIQEILRIWKLVIHQMWDRRGQIQALRVSGLVSLQFFLSTVTRTILFPADSHYSTYHPLIASRSYRVEPRSTAQSLTFKWPSHPRLAPQPLCIQSQNSHLLPELKKEMNFNKMKKNPSFTIHEEKQH